MSKNPEHRLPLWAGITTAWGLFTIVPAPFVAEIDRRLAARAIAAFPWLGLALGVVSAAIGYGLWWRSGSTSLAAVGALATLTALTGAMHLDGLADTADGLGSRKAPDQALAVMRRSDIGPMGVTAVLLTLLLDAAALAAIPQPLCWGAVALFPLVGRTSVLWASSSRNPAARGDGFGVLFVGVTGTATALIGTVCTVTTCAGIGWWLGSAQDAAALAAAALIATLCGAGWQRHLIRRLGGLTGDTFGSLIEVSQLAFALVASLLVSR